MLELLDDLLDFSLVLSYTHLGYHLRRLLLWPAGELDCRLDGRVCVVTGANSGLGLAAARGLAERGATVILACRDAAKGEAARSKLSEACGGDRVRAEQIDLANLNSVRACAERLLGRESRIDVLINNAGVLLPERQLSADGIELTFATNVLGGFMLTSLMLPRLVRTAKEHGSARVIHVSSGGMYARRLNADDLQFEREPFDGTTAYAQSKRAQVILNELWAERLAGTGVISSAMHPGWVDTPGLASSLPGFHQLMRWTLRDADQGADTILWLAAAERPAAESGTFWFDRQMRPTEGIAAAREPQAIRAKLWAECERLCGLSVTQAPDRLHVRADQVLRASAEVEEVGSSLRQFLKLPKVPEVVVHGHHGHHAHPPPRG